MLIERNEFFKEASLSIYSSLDFGQALEKTFQFITRHLPIDGLFVNICEENDTIIRTMASIRRGGGLEKNIRIPLNEECIEFLKGALDGWNERADTQRAHIHPSAEDTPMGRLEGPILGYEGRSIMAQLLHIEGDFFGVVIASAPPGGTFTEEHLKLYESLKQPFSIALANTLSYEKVTNLKDRLADENRFLTQELQTRQNFTVVGAEGGMKHIVGIIARVAPQNNTVLLLGETGVGKEVVANAIHSASPRSHGPFIKVNCGAIPEELIDSELFGHEKGAFTGATTQKKGRFERANGGTIFLDEIGELPMAAQVRLLRVLQTKEIERVGGTKSIPVDIRVIAATHRKLEQMISENKFREDLWYRINVFPIIIPPLRQRRQDIPLLVQHFIEKKSREMGLRTAPTIADGALKLLTEYHWPGNVRELENVVERALIQNRDRTLQVDPFTFTTVKSEKRPELSEEHSCVFPCLARQSMDEEPQEPAPDPLQTLDAVVSKQIKETLTFTKGKVGGKDGAAALLGLNPSTLRNKMIKLGIPYGRQVSDG